MFFASGRKTFAAPVAITLSTSECHVPAITCRKAPSVGKRLPSKVFFTIMLPCIVYM